MINTLQGYRFNKDDIWGLQFSYANKQTNVLHSQHGAKSECSKEPNPNNNNNNSIVIQTVNSGSDSKDANNNTSKKWESRTAQFEKSKRSNTHASSTGLLPKLVEDRSQSVI